jgi:hypothetical protein
LRCLRLLGQEPCHFHAKIWATLHRSLIPIHGADSSEIWDPLDATANVVLVTGELLHQRRAWTRERAVRTTLLRDDNRLRHSRSARSPVQHRSQPGACGSGPRLVPRFRKAGTPTAPSSTTTSTTRLVGVGGLVATIDQRGR